MSFSISSARSDVPLKIQKIIYNQKSNLKAPITKQFVIEQLKKPKYRVTRETGYFFVNGIQTPGITSQLPVLYSWPRYTKDPTRRSSNTCHLFNTCYRCIMCEFNKRNLIKADIDTMKDIVTYVLTGIAPITHSKATEFAIKWHQLGKMTKCDAAQAWEACCISKHMGIELDKDLKTVALTGALDKIKYKETIKILEFLTEHHLEPIDVDLRVTSYKTAHDDHTSQHCLVCAGEMIGQQFSTELDLICWHPINKKIYLIEYKTTRNARVTEAAFRRHRYQAWLSWIMFSNTYPQLCDYSDSKILILSLSYNNPIEFYDVVPFTLQHKTTTYFPFVTQWCSVTLALMCPVGTPATNPTKINGRKRRCIRSPGRMPMKRFSIAQPINSENILKTFNQYFEESISAAN